MLLREILLTLPSLSTTSQGDYLEQACAGDDDLRREAESLMGLDPDVVLPEIARTGGIPRALDLSGAVNVASSEEVMPERVGPFLVLGVLGRGGMGVVYRAEQTEPIRREVAIKLIRHGLDRRLVLARFQAEQRTLAIMEHPAIARVFEAGEDMDGSPYFVMELVRGIPITQFCGASDVTTDDCLRLFRAVCEAVQHAHQKGIIHRDLKPSNILVTTQEGAPAPKVIDFGIAKALEESAPGTTLTRDGQLVGTLEYMSPEQACGRAEDVDTRSDVYGLGVILYELLSGRLPYETRGMALVEAARVIAEEPPQPIRPTAVGDTRTDPDLVTIALKALEKEPARRYASAAALAEDIGRYLDGEPVLAHPPSTVYQIRKMIARNRVPVALAASLVVLLAVFGLTMSVLFQSQRVERARAEAEADKAQAVSTFLSEMLSSINSNGRSVTVREVLNVAARDIDAKFAEQPEVKAAIHSTIGSALRALGEGDEAGAHLRAAFEIRRAAFGDRHPEVATSLSELADYELGARAVDATRRADSLANVAYAIRRDMLGDEHPDVTESLVQLADLHTGAGRDSLADSLYLLALDRTRRDFGPAHWKVGNILHSRAVPLFSSGRIQEAEDHLREALSIFERAYPGDNARTSACMSDLAFLIRDPAERESLQVEHLAMERRLWGNEHPNLINALNALAHHHLDRLRFDKGEPLCREALAIAERSYEPDHVMVGEACNDLACQLRGRGEYEEAAELFRRALDIFRLKLGPRNEYIGICRANLAMTFDQLGRDEEARVLLEEALAGWEDDPSKPGAPVLDHRRMAAFLNHRERWQEAAEHAEAALVIVRGNAYQLQNWASSAQELATARHGQGRLAEASALHAEVDSLRRENGQVTSAGIQNLLEWGTCLREMGLLDVAARRLDEAHSRALEEFGEKHQAYAEYLVALAELDADRGAWDSARARAGDARAALTLQVEAEAGGRGTDWLGRKVRRASLARANTVLERARAAGYSLRAG